MAAPLGDTAGALTGAIISAAFAVAWALWGASGLSSGAASVIEIVAILAGLALIGRAAVLRRSAPRGTPGGSMFSSAAYRWIVAIEVVALLGGGAILSATGETAYTIAWFAFIVGAHFLWFGRAFWTGFYVIGIVLIAGALAGALIGLTGGSAADVRAMTGLTAAAVLYLASAWTVLGADRPDRSTHDVGAPQRKDRVPGR
jgi:hypothetical protein